MTQATENHFLLTVLEWRKTLPVWSDPDIFVVYATHIKTGRRVLVTAVSDDQKKVHVRIPERDFQPWTDPAVFYHGWWATLDELTDWAELHRNGTLLNHAPIIAEFVDSDKTFDASNIRNS